MSEDSLDDLKKHPKIFDLYASRVALKKGAANRFRASCPFGEHQDKNPSFDVYLQDGLWLYGCFSCGAKGNIFQFIEKTDNCSFKEAVHIVRTFCSEFANARTQVENTFRPLATEPKKVVTYTESQYKAYEEALKNSPEAQAFLQSRGIGYETVQRLRLGFRQDVGKLAGEANAGIAGLGWICFPCFGSSSEDGQPVRSVVTSLKYRSIKLKAFTKQPGMQTALFNTRTIDFLEPVFLLEGEIDVLTMEQAGLRGVGLPNATYSVSPQDKDLLLSAEYVILAGDNDDAGKKVMEKLWREMNISGRVFYLKWPGLVKDANEFYLKECKGDVSVFRTKIQALATDAKSRPLPNVVSLPESMQQSTWSGLENHPDRLVFPWKQIDSMVNLLPGSVLNVTATQTGMGKTAWLMNLLIHACKMGKTVLNYSAELSAEEYGNIVTAHILRKDRSDVSADDLKAAARMIAGYKFYIGRDPDAHNSDQVLDLLDKAIPILGIDIFAVDHIHHICQGKTNDVKDQNEAIVKIKNIATKHGVCAIVVSQPRKADANSKGKEIHITDIKGGGGIADASDAVLSLHRDFIKTVDPDNPPAEPYESLTKVRLLKGRSQGRGKAYCELAFLGALATFVDVTHQAEPTLFGGGQ